jgi:transposase
MLRDASWCRRVIIKCGRTDLRRGITGLVSIIRLEYGLDPLEEGTLFLFCGNKRNCIKGICFDRDGYCMVVKRLTDGKYQWPRSTDEAMDLSPRSSTGSWRASPYSPPSAFMNADHNDRS